MTFSEISPIDFLKITVATIVVSSCAYCIWNGRKVFKKWIDHRDVYICPTVRTDRTVVRKYRTSDSCWDEDENNPANWYLKVPK